MRISRKDVWLNTYKMNDGRISISMQNCYGSYVRIVLNKTETSQLINNLKLTIEENNEDSQKVETK